MRTTLLYILGMYWAIHPACAQSTYALDGDSIRDGSRNIRLFGIDAPELEQLCDGTPVGLLAQRYLQQLLDKGTFMCRSMGVDKYSRSLGVCTVGTLAGMIEVNKEMVRSGHAFAYRKYSNDYTRDEASGPVHKYHCQQPEQWRKENKR